MSIALRLSGITKRFAGKAANDGIDLELRRGEVLALLGENGAGKTTLMSILFGHYLADAGTVEVADAGGGLRPLPPGSPSAALAAGIGMVHQHFALAGSLSAMDNVLLGAEPLWAPRRRRRAARDRLRGIMGECGLDVPLEAPAGRLSVGERQRVEILKALWREVRVLILDEPTALLTPGEAERLFATCRRLAAGGLAILFISHKLDEVMRFADRIAVLRAGRMVAEFAGDAMQPGSVAQAMLGSAAPEVRRLPATPGPPRLELHGLAVAGSPGVGDVDLALRAGEIVGIAGVSGNGQRALAAFLAGLRPALAGEARLDGGPWPEGGPRALRASGIGRVPEDRLQDGLVGEMSVAENLVLEAYAEPRFQRRGFARRAAIAAHAAALVSTYDVRCNGPGQRTALLSGGNMQKLLLARVLEAAPGVVLADQPTRGLDLGAVAFVHRRLLEARAGGAAILLISEDLDEILKLADRVAVMHRGRLTAPLPAGEVTLRGLGLLMTGGDRRAA